MSLRGQRQVCSAHALAKDCSVPRVSEHTSWRLPATQSWLQGGQEDPTPLPSHIQCRPAGFLAPVSLSKIQAKGQRAATQWILCPVLTATRPVHPKRLPHSTHSTQHHSIQHTAPTPHGTQHPQHTKHSTLNTQHPQHTDTAPSAYSIHTTQHTAPTAHSTHNTHSNTKKGTWVTKGTLVTILPPKLSLWGRCSDRDTQTDSNILEKAGLKSTRGPHPGNPAGRGGIVARSIMWQVKPLPGMPTCSAAHPAPCYWPWKGSDRS